MFSYHKTSCKYSVSHTWFYFLSVFFTFSDLHFLPPSYNIFFAEQTFCNLFKNVVKLNFHTVTLFLQSKF